MILSKLIYDVREGIKEYTDDSEVSNRYIIHLYNIKRAKYLRQDLNNYQKTADNSILQSFCLSLEEVSANECNVEYDCKTLLRSKQPIPTPLELHTKVAITKIKPTNRLSIPFNMVTKDKVAYLDGATFKSSLYAFIDVDEYIYIVSKNDESYKILDCITVTGVFEDPLELANYQNCCGCSTSTVCFDELESEYPLQPHYIDLIRREIVNDLLQLKQIKEDKENNSNDI
jgi:hypothetical protein